MQELPVTAVGADRNYFEFTNAKRASSLKHAVVHMWQFSDLGEA